MRISSKKATRAVLRRSAVAALGLAVCGSAWALSLGRIVLQSGRGEPLRAEVEIAAISPEEAASLSAAIASAEAYRRAGVSLSPSLAEARVGLAQRSDGRQVLRISSLQPVQDEFLDLILEINWASGALTREYTLLFEASKATAQEPAPAAAAPPLLGPAPTPALPSVPDTPARAAAPVPQAPAAAAAPPKRYTVRRGDTLSGVASRMARPGVSLDQMLVALYRSNPHAFINKNMNLLRADAVLRLPSAQEAAQVARTEARQVVRMQSADFDAYRERLARRVPAARLAESARRSGGAVEAAVEDRRTAPTAPDRLRLSRAPGSSPEVTLSREAARRDQAQRVAELSRNVEELRRLAANSANAAAAAASDAASAPNALGLSMPGAAAASAPMVASAPASGAEADAQDASASVPGAMDAASAVEEAASAPVALAAASAASAVDVVPPPAPPEAADGLTSLVRNWWLGMAGVLGALVVGGVGVVLLRKRRKAASETSFLESRLQPDSFFGGHSAQPTGLRDSAQPAASEQYSLSQLDAIGDVDPVAEADVYLAYGRDLQAEEILKEAMRSNPQRLSIRTKLLEVYAKRQDVKAFELLAQQLQQITQGEGEDWTRARELGQQIDPSNPLYDEAAAAAKRAPDTMSPSTWPQDVEAPAPKPPTERLDLDLDQLATEPAPAPSLEQTRPVVTGMERPTPAPVSTAAPVATSPAAAVAATAAAVTQAAAVAASAAAQDRPVTELQPEDDDTVSLDFGPSEPTRASAPAPTVPSEGTPSLPFDLDSLSLDLDEPSTASVLSELNLSSFGEEEADPLQRKLDLAEEFRQIGENDAARDLLQEVVAKASGDVKTRAQSMLDSLV